MAEDTRMMTANLPATSHIPIAQLTPLLAAPSSRSVKAVVTLTWPYSSATKSIAFLLAEPDFRLRRTRGQVRVQFSGSSARAIAASGIASGDEATLCLDGVEFVHNETAVSTPGRGVEFELRFTERLILEFQAEGAQKPNIINIDHPEAETEPSSHDIVRELTPETSPAVHPSANGTPKRPDVILADDEFASPAFIKRARTSYGSLWEDELDLEDGTIKGKGRKRSRLSSTWTYTSRSATPESEIPEQIESISAPITPIQTVNKPQATVDEGIQTDDFEDGAPEALLAFARQSMAHFEEVNPVNGTLLESRDTNLPKTAGRSTIVTEFVSSGEEVVQDQSPSSPQLQPQPSHNSPLVSPLLSRGSGTFANQSELKGLFAQPSGDHENTAISNLTESHIEDEIRDDLYSATPMRQSNDHGPSVFEDFSAAHPDFNNPSPYVSGADFRDEDQYGRWESETNQLGYQESPFTSSNILKDHRDGSPAGREDSPEDDIRRLPSLQRDDQQIHQYPELDEVLSGSQHSSMWQPQPISVSYPELQDQGDNLDALVRTLSQPHSHQMSRSASVLSVVVDLIESDEEDVDLQEPSITPSPKKYEGSAEEEYSEEYSEGEDGYGDENNLPTDYVSENSPQPEMLERQQPHNEDFEADARGPRTENQPLEYESEEDEERGDSDDEEYDSEGYPYEKYASSQNPYGEEGEEESEEPGYYKEGEEDEEEEDTESESLQTRPAQQKEPVVIDLLSSDDEEDVAASTESDARQTDAEMSDVFKTRLIREQDIDHSDDQADAQPSGCEDDEEEEHSDTSGVEVRDGGNMGTSHEAPLSTENVLSDDERPQSSIEDEDEDPVEIEIQIRSGEADTNNIYQMEVDSGEPPSTSPEKSGSQSRIRSLASPFGLDGADNYDTQEEAMLQSSTPPVSKSGTLTEINKVIFDKASPQRPSFFSRMFGIDGANDEPEERVTYPTLPNILPPATAASSQNVAPSFGVRFTIGADTLPTPDDTQVTENLLSLRSSFTSTDAMPHFDFDTPQMALDETKDVVLPMADEVAIADGVITDVESERIPEHERATEESPEIHFVGRGAADKSDTEDVPIEIENTGSATTTELSHVPEPSAREITPETPNFTSESPRRSHRRVKSTNRAISNNETIAPAMTKPPIQKRSVRSVTPVAANQKENLRAITPRAVNNLENVKSVDPVTPLQVTKAPPCSSTEKQQQSPGVVIDKPTTPRGHDASIELALSSLNSPEHDLRRTPILDLKLRLNRNLRTELEHFKSLKILRYELNRKLDVLAIATTVPPVPERAKNGPRHYVIMFNITDPSIAPAGVTEVQIYRPYKEALPIIEVGDGILLRGFQVISLKNRGFGLRSEPESSSWAVFKGGDDVEVRGPPVEYGSEEKNHITQMKVWYENLDLESIAKLRRANGVKSSGAGV